MWPKIWSRNGTVQKYVPGSINSERYNEFHVYVDENESFISGLPEFGITNDQEKFYTFENPYFVACCAAYCITYMCGISTKHFNDRTSKLISSIARYHFYYHMMRFLRDPESLKTYMRDENIEFVEKKTPVKYKWKWEFDQTKVRLDLWVRRHKRGTVKDYYTSQSKYGGQIGIHYLKRGGRTYHNINDYMIFIAGESKGLTELGQLLLQQSIESYVYSVLGSQASTRWSIVGQGAMSLQTQKVFRKIVKSTIIEDDVTVAIGNMRKAIADTNVVLNAAITPGIVLVPARMIILKEKIPGYNNILKLASKEMKFGVNSKVNKEEVKVDVVVSKPVEKEKKKEEKVEDLVERPPHNYNFTSDDDQTGKLGVVLASSTLAGIVALRVVSSFL